MQIQPLSDLNKQLYYAIEIAENVEIIMKHINRVDNLSNKDVAYDDFTTAKVRCSQLVQKLDSLSPVFRAHTENLKGAMDEFETALTNLGLTNNE